ncbi:MAG TPA: acyl-CoA thioesterase/bile acid-CoA:amino acid N-acyltransferase family protein [Acidimicrobiales bacterium]|nr:acyl-CoA thioesterase/bile acid-CoA:amino acid N-acyltransferase family protein [Acidimicrobiales bacterium]
MRQPAVDAVDPDPLMDEPVRFRVEGLAPGRVVSVLARWVVGDALVSSCADFRADDDGVVEPGAQPSLAGSYRGEDPFGLWWSAATASGDPPRRRSLEPLWVSVAVVAGGERLAGAVLRRRWVGSGVQVTPIGEDGLVATSFRPAGTGPFPAAVVLGGSLGGLGGAETKAALLASRGIAALAVAYFAAPGRPPDLAEIPVEYVGACLTWLRARSHVDAGRLAVLGSSRGAELALLVAAAYPQVRRVVAAAPSSVVWGAVGRGAAPGTAAWTVDGRPLPTMRHWRSDLADAAYAGDPVRLAPLFDDALDGQSSAGTAEIPVERARGPVLLISGGDDAMWPARRMAEAVERRAAACGGPSVRHLHHPQAGHLCAGPPGTAIPTVICHPLDGRRYLMGGTPEANAAAAASSWQQTLEFLLCEVA